MICAVGYWAFRQKLLRGVDSVFQRVGGMGAAAFQNRQIGILQLLPGTPRCAESLQREPLT